MRLPLHANIQIHYYDQFAKTYFPPGLNPTTKYGVKFKPSQFMVSDKSKLNEIYGKNIRVCAEWCKIADLLRTLEERGNFNSRS